MSDGTGPEDARPRRRWPMPVRAAAVVAHVTARSAVSLYRRIRRRRLIMGLALRAVWGRARIHHEIATDVALARHVKFVVTPRTTNMLRIGPGCSIGDDVLVHLDGGTLVMTESVEIRARCALHIRGALRFAGTNILSYGCTMHCDEQIDVEHMASFSEYVTIVDSSHTHHGGDEWFVANIRSAPVVIGANAWLGAKVTVARGVHLGERSVVGANSVVISDVPADCLASGVPAKIVKRLGGDTLSENRDAPPGPAARNGQARERDATRSS